MRARDPSATFTDMPLQFQIHRRVVILAILLLVTGFSFWLLNHLGGTGQRPHAGGKNLPDYYMEDFSTIHMDSDGIPSHYLRALYIAHYPENDSTELLQPALEFQRPGDTPIQVSADKGWVTGGNEVILLDGDVEFLERNHAGETLLQIRTQKARILPDSGYAETDQQIELLSGQARMTGTGMRAYLHTGRLEVLSHVRTTINTR